MRHLMHPCRILVLAALLACLAAPAAAQVAESTPTETVQAELTKARSAYYKTKSELAAVENRLYALKQASTDSEEFKDLACKQINLVNLAEKQKVEIDLLEETYKAKEKEYSPR